MNEIEERAKDSRFFHVENDTEPDKPSISDAEEGGLRRVFDSLRTLVSVLGYPIFDPEEYFPVVKPEGVSYGSPATMTAIKQLLASGSYTVEELADKLSKAVSTIRTCITYMNKDNSPIGLTKTRKTADGKYRLQE